MDNISDDLKELAKELAAMPDEMFQHAPAWLQKTVKDAREQLKKG